MCEGDIVSLGAVLSEDVRKSCAKVVERLETLQRDSLGSDKGPSSQKAWGSSYI